MEVPRGFIRCGECEGRGWTWDEDRTTGVYDLACPSCSGSGLLPTDQLREDAEAAIRDVRESLIPGATHLVGAGPEADAVLRKVAEHLGGRE